MIKKKISVNHKQRGNFLNLIKTIYKKPKAKKKAKSVLNGEKLRRLTKIRYKTRMSPLTTPFQHCTRKS